MPSVAFMSLYPEKLVRYVLGMPPYAPKIWNYASPIMLLKLVIMLLLCSGNAPKNNGIIGIITA